MLARRFETKFEIAGIIPRRVAGREILVAAAKPHARVDAKARADKKLRGKNGRGFRAADGRIRRCREILRIKNRRGCAHAAADVRNDVAVVQRQCAHDICHKRQVVIIRAVVSEEIDVIHFCAVQADFKINGDIWIELKTARGIHRKSRFKPHMVVRGHAEMHQMCVAK